MSHTIDLIIFWLAVVAIGTPVLVAAHRGRTKTLQANARRNHPTNKFKHKGA